MDNFLFDMIVIVGIFIAGWNCGSLYTILQVNSILKKASTALNNIKTDKSDDTKNFDRAEVLHLDTMVHDNMIYLYDHITKDFICQAKTLDELAKLSKEYKNITKAFVQYEGTYMLFDNGVVVKL